MMNANERPDRFGVITGDGVKHWFYLSATAVIYCKEHGGRIVWGILRNDEGCTPWIETIRVFD